MFQQVTFLVSFIFAIALTRVLSSASQLILARERVRFSWLVSVSLYGLPLGICAVVAGWSKPRWLQWVGVVGLFISYFVLFTLGS
jgi:hypothetical protein